MTSISEPRPVPGTDISPTPIRSLFWHPRFTRDSSILVHVPVLFWLTEAMQARRITVLGVGCGTAYFALCQALDKSGHPGTCTGVGLWDDPATVPLALTEHAQSHYDGLSRLHAIARPQDAPAVLSSDEEIDILVMDFGALPPEPLCSDDLRSIAARARVLVIHGSWDRLDRNLTDVLEETRTSVRIIGGEGLTLCVSADVPPAVAEVITALGQLDTAAFAATAFRRLGQGLVAAETAHSLSAKFDREQPDLSNLQKAQAGTQIQLSEVQAGYDLRGVKLAELQIRLFQAERTLHEHHLTIEAERLLRFEETATLTRLLETERSRLERSQNNLEKSEQSNKVLAERNNALDERKKVLIERNGTLTKRNNALTERNSAMTKRNNALAERKKVLIERNGTLTKRNNALTERNSALTRRINKLTRELDRIRKSRSWRITGPIRRVSRLLYRRS